MTLLMPPGISGPAGSARVVTRARSVGGPTARVRPTGPRAHVCAASRGTLARRPILALRAVVAGQTAADEIVARVDGGRIPGAGDVGDQDVGRVRAPQDDRLAARIRAEELVVGVRARAEPGPAVTAARGRQRADLDAVQDDVVGGPPLEA